MVPNTGPGPKLKATPQAPRKCSAYRPGWFSNFFPELVIFAKVNIFCFCLHILLNLTPNFLLRAQRLGPVFLSTKRIQIFGHLECHLMCYKTIQHLSFLFQGPTHHIRGPCRNLHLSVSSRGWWGWYWFACYINIYSLCYVLFSVLPRRPNYSNRRCHCTCASGSSKQSMFKPAVIIFWVWVYSIFLVYSLQQVIFTDWHTACNGSPPSPPSPEGDTLVSCPQNYISGFSK